MKLLLSDGTAVAVSSYEKTNTTVNGNTVDAISIIVEKTTLEKVKNLFADSDNLAVLHMYSDENILIDTFNGYQIRKSIALGDTDTSFIILLAKSSEVNEQLTHLTTEISAVKETVTTLASSVEALVKAMETVNFNQEDNVKKFTEQAKSIEAMTESINTIKESVSEQKDGVNNLEIDFGKIKTSFNEFATLSQQISNSYASMVEAVNTTNAASTQALSSVDKAYQAMTLRSDSIDQLMGLMDEVKNLATGNDEKVIQYGQSAEILTEGVNAAKLAVEQFEANLTTVSKNVKDVTTQIQETGNQISTITESVKGVQEGITTLESKHTETTNTIEGLTNRVSGLEPVTDYTTLSLDDAKKFRIEESKVALATYLDEHPITSTCHAGIEGQYSITSEKQNFLQAMISITMLAEQNGVEYQPSWNKVGESCTYDWTLAELQQLAIEIEATVRPLVSHQQALEKEILAVKTMKALQAVDIAYDAIQPNPIVVKETTTETTESTEG